MLPLANDDWWEEYKYLSDEINPESWFDVMKDWDSWRKEGYRMYFRGESACLNENCNDLDKNSTLSKHILSCSYKPFPLLPSLLREHNFEKLSETWHTNDARQLEEYLLDHYIRHTAHLMESEGQFASKNLAPLEMLCLAQHYGLPTRLLDWSLNPFIALYFALAGSWKRGNFNPYEAARLWVMILKDEPYRAERTIHLEKKEQKDKNQNSVVQLAIDEGKRLWFEEAPFIVVPLVFTPRIAAQSGRFIYCSNLTKGGNSIMNNGSTCNNRLDRVITKHVLRKPKRKANKERLDNKLIGLEKIKYFYNSEKDEFKPTHDEDLTEETKKYPWSHLICYPITLGEGKLEMLKQLEFRGYHAGHLFPDLGGWATYLQQGFR